METKKETLHKVVPSDFQPQAKSITITLISELCDWGDIFCLSGKALMIQGRCSVYHGTKEGLKSNPKFPLQAALSGLSTSPG